MVQWTKCQFSGLCCAVVLFGCSAGAAGSRANHTSPSAPEPSAAPAPVIEVAPEPPAAAVGSPPSTPEPSVEADPEVDVGGACRGADLQLGALRDAGLCAAPPKAERLSYDVTRRLQLVSQPLSVAPGARLDFIAQLKNISQRPVVVEIQVGSGFSSVSSHSLTQAGSPVLVGKCNVSYLTSSEWYRVEIPAGASLGLDGRFFANIARVSAEDAPCPPPPLTRGSYELKVSVTVNGQELSGQAELRVR